KLLVFKPIEDKVDALHHTMLKGSAGDNSVLRWGKLIHAQLILNGFSSNLFAMTGVGYIEYLRIGKSIHAYVLGAGFESLVNISTALVDMHFKCGVVGIARLIFDRMSDRNVVSWNSMINCYLHSGDAEEAILVIQMLIKVSKPTNVTVMGALRACADLGDLQPGMLVHKLVDDFNLSSDISVTNSMTSMYWKCKKVDTAAAIFKNLKVNMLVSWNAQNEPVNGALNYFCEMQWQNIKPDSFSLVTLVDVYAKCGAVHTARKLFDMIIVRHLETWNAMINGYGTHGLECAALELFRKMQKGAMRPNDATFVCTLCLQLTQGAQVGRTMEKKGLQKTPSLMELRNEFHTFYSWSTSHPQSKKICASLETMGDKIKAAGYVAELCSVFMM
ncbi:Pentatricopeptide repeat, partial [Dillenia turbinata]